MLQLSRSLLKSRSHALSLLARYAVALLGAVLLAAGAARSDSRCVQLSGAMHTAGNFTKVLVVRVPAGLRDITINLPVPSDADQNGWAQTLQQCVAASSVPPTRQFDQTDRNGNRYSVLEFLNPQTGNIRITQKVYGLATDSGLTAPLPDASYPLRAAPHAVAPYLKPSRRAQSDDPQIAELSRLIVHRSGTEADAVSRIATWIFGNIDYADGAYINAIDACTTLSARAGQCQGYANLFVALARAAGIPARQVTGYTLAGSLDIPVSSDGSARISMDIPSSPHAWVEVWYPGAGWIPYDPQSSAGFIDSHHIEYSVDGPDDTSRALVEWTASGRALGRVTYQERTSVDHLSDHISLNYVDERGDDLFGRILLERQRSMPAAPQSDTMARE